jgi:superfamily II DNA or RNA helicase
MLSLKNLRCGLIVGEMKEAARDVVIKQAKAGHLDVVVATSNLAAEGLDIPNLSCVHLTMPTSNVGKLKQSIGRVCRVVDGKKALAVDYADIDNEILNGMLHVRKRFYHGSKYLIE